MIKLFLTKGAPATASPEAFVCRRGGAFWAAKAALVRYTRTMKSLVLYLVGHPSDRPAFRRALAHQIVTQARKGLKYQVWGTPTQIPGWALLARALFNTERPKMEVEARAWVREHLLSKEEEALERARLEFAQLEAEADWEESPHFEAHPTQQALTRARLRLREQEARVTQLRQQVSRLRLFEASDGWLPVALALGIEAPQWYNWTWLEVSPEGKRGIHPLFLYLVAALRNQGRHAVVAERLGLRPDHRTVRLAVKAMALLQEGHSEQAALEATGLDPETLNAALGRRVALEEIEVATPEKEYDPTHEWQLAALEEVLTARGLSAENVSLDENLKKEVVNVYASLLPMNQEERQRVASSADLLQTLREEGWL